MLDAHEDCIDWQHLPDDLVEDLSRVAIRVALESSCGNMAQAARRLGISRQTLYRKLNH